MKEFLTREEPDIVMINVSGKYKESITKLCKNYKAYYSLDSLCILHKKNLNAAPNGYNLRMKF